MSAAITTPQPTPASAAQIVVGVDTHQGTHHAAVIDIHHTRLGHRQFPADAAGYRALHQWAAGHGEITLAAVESTGSYGAALTRHLTAQGLVVIEVGRPEKSTRYKDGKSDPIDAYSAAEQALARRATAKAKDTTGLVEALRMVKGPRDSAVKHRTCAYNQLRDLITTAPDTIRDQLLPLTTRQRLTKAAAMRPDPARITEPEHAARYALRALARRITELDAEIDAADQHIARLTRKACPRLLAMPQVGPQSAAQLMITAGQNIDRMRTEATFAKLCGVAPLPASSGKTTRHRLNRGGDRQANSALYMITIGRMGNHPETIAYVERRTQQKMTNAEIIRCLKRHLARQIYKALTADLTTAQNTA